MVSFLGDTPSYKPSGVTVAVRPKRIVVMVLSNVILTILRGRPVVDAESERRIRGQREEWKNLPATDLVANM